MERKPWLLCLGLALAATGCTTMEAQINSSGTLGQTDKDYATIGSQLVQLDTQADKLAMTKASDPRIIDLATQIQAQADALSPGFKAALNAEGVKPATGMAPDMAAEIGQLKTLSGAAFDHQYVADELAIHKQALSAFQAEDTKTNDAALRSQVETELPAVQGDLDKLQTLSGEFTQTHG